MFSIRKKSKVLAFVKELKAFAGDKLHMKFACDRVENIARGKEENVGIHCFPPFLQ